MRKLNIARFKMHRETNNSMGQIIWLADHVLDSDRMAKRASYWIWITTLEADVYVYIAALYNSSTVHCIVLIEYTRTYFSVFYISMFNVQVLLSLV